MEKRRNVAIKTLPIMGNGIVNYQCAGRVVENAKHFDVLHAVLLERRLQQLNDVAADDRWTVETLRPRHQLGRVERMLLHGERECEAHRDSHVDRHALRYHEVLNAIGEIVEELDAAPETRFVGDVIELDLLLRELPVLEFEQNHSKVRAAEIEGQVHSGLVTVGQLGDVSVLHLQRRHLLVESR